MKKIVETEIFEFFRNWTVEPPSRAPYSISVWRKTHLDAGSDECIHDCFHLGRLPKKIGNDDYKYNMMMITREEECGGMEALPTKTSQISFYCSSRLCLKLVFIVSDSIYLAHAEQNMLFKTNLIRRKCLRKMLMWQQDDIRIKVYEDLMRCWPVWQGRQQSWWAQPCGRRWGRRPGWPCRTRSRSRRRTTRLRLQQWGLRWCRWCRWFDLPSFDLSSFDLLSFDWSSFDLYIDIGINGRRIERLCSEEGELVILFMDPTPNFPKFINQGLKSNSCITS